MSRRPTNVPAGAGKVTMLDPAVDRALMATFPKAIRDYILYEAPGPADSRIIQQMITHHGAEQTLLIMKAITLNDVKQFYGPGHPSLGKQ